MLSKLGSKLVTRVFADSPGPEQGRKAEHWWDLPRATALLWTVLVVLAVGRAALYASPRHQGCYTVFADGARNWLAGQDLFDSINPNSLNVFRYCPIVAVLLAPLAWLSDPWGSAALRAVGLAIFLPGLWWWCRVALPHCLPRKAVSLCILLVAALCPNSLMDVQLNIITIGLMLLTMAALEANQLTFAALACALAVCFKAYPAALALVLSVLYWRQFSWRWLGAMAVVMATPFFFQRFDYVLRQYQDWIHYGLNARYVEDRFQDVMFLCRRCSVPMSRGTYQVVEILAGVGIAAVCLIHRWRGLPEKSLRNAAFGLCCGWMMAFGPATEATTYIILAPAAAAAAVMAWSLPNPRWFRLAIAVVCVLLSLSQLQLLFPLNKPLEHAGALPIAAMLFIVAVAIHGMGCRVWPYQLVRLGPRTISLFDRGFSSTAAHPANLNPPSV
jgi:alpha-1,2-mannosyltransferase